MGTDGRLEAAGSSPAAIRKHYDVSDEFFRLWLGDDLVYSCALWDTADPDDSLGSAQDRKLDFFADGLGVAGARVLDVGCGWGALLDRWVRVHGAAGGVGLTLSPAQVARARAGTAPAWMCGWRAGPTMSRPSSYDVVTCIESTEHFASDAMSADEKVQVYSTFFERAAGWLRPGGRLGLQLICLDNVGHAGSRPGRGPLTDLLLDEIFPEAMSPSLSELAIGWETHFQLDTFVDHTEHYRRTFRAWTLAYRDRRDQALRLVGPGTARIFERYFAAGEACFRLREQALFRATLTRRPDPKVWATPPRLPSGTTTRPHGASPEAVQAHYDLSNDFYRLWLGPTMMYSSGMWPRTGGDLDSAVLAKADYFAEQVIPRRGARFLDIGCGWGGMLDRAVSRHGVTDGTGLTLSPAQRGYVGDLALPGVDVRLEGWEDHRPRAPYGAITSFGAFEHFARDGSSSADRVDTYRDFFARCFDWLVPGGRLGLETIAHDQAPDTDHLLGRGPLGDSVLELFPESICPQLCELVLGFEPYFEVEVLRSDAADFARTFRAWMLALRSNREAAEALVGAETTYRFHRYLVASEAQFRTGALTNYRLVLHRRERLRW